MNVERYMERRTVTVLPETPVSEVEATMEENRFSIMLVVAEDGKLAGFVTRASLKGADGETPIEQVAHPVKFAVVPSDTLEKAALIMLENRLVILPVAVDDRLVGVITQGEILRGLASGLGIGLPGTRLTVRTRVDSDDLYRVLEVLREHDVRLVSLAQGGGDGTHREVILRVQGIEDRERLRADLEACLREG
ncbi:hypothetical protein DRJ24_04430 [Candidatus Acetothermia bacterium]|nr:MAG: hypothetical protein DRJ24_04430 [Candidatus Acetothermia bacterium]